MARAPGAPVGGEGEHPEPDIQSDPAWHEASAEADAAGTDGPQTPHLDLHSDDRLPWLEGDDDEYRQPADDHRIAGLVSAGVLMVAAVVGSIYFLTHRHEAAAPVADGSIVAPADAGYKAAPANAGGKTYEGTGDTSFAVSQGKRPDEHLATNDAGAANGATAASKPAGEASAAAAAASDAAGGDAGAGKPAVAAPPAGGAGGGVVQLAAFNSAARAEQAWSQMSSSHDVLSGLTHRVVQGQIDAGTVYRLQVLTGAGGGGALCGKIHAAGLDCRVKQ